MDVTEEHWCEIWVDSNVKMHQKHTERRRLIWDASYTGICQVRMCRLKERQTLPVCQWVGTWPVPECWRWCPCLLHWLLLAAAPQSPSFPEEEEAIPPLGWRGKKIFRRHTPTICWCPGSTKQYNSVQFNTTTTALKGNYEVKSTLLCQQKNIIYFTIVGFIINVKL